MNKLLGLAFIANMVLLCNVNVFCQTDALLKNGHTYARAYLPNQFKVEFKLVKSYPSCVDFVKQEAQYDTVTLGLMAHAETKEILVGVYDFEVVGEPKLTISNDMALIHQNDEFDVRYTIQEGVAKKWRLSNLALCDSPQNDCDLFDWVEVSAQYIENAEDIGKSTAKDNQLIHSIAFFNIQVEESSKLIPVEYRFYTKIEKVESEQNLVIETPAIYEMQFQKIPLVSNLKKEWIEVMSVSKLDQYVISQIQFALKGRKIFKCFLAFASKKFKVQNQTVSQAFILSFGPNMQSKGTTQSKNTATRAIIPTAIVPSPATSALCWTGC